MSKGRFVRTDPHPDNIRALWDSIHGLKTDLTTAQSTVTAQAALIKSLQTSLHSTQEIARTALTKATTAQPPGTEAASGSSPSPTPSDGPVIPNPGTPPPIPPNQPPTSGPLSAVDLLDPTTFVYKNSINVSSWTITAHITKIDWQVNGVFVDFDRRNPPNRWPDQPWGAPGDSVQYTLWAVLLISGTYYASGVMQFWYGLDRNGGPPSGFAANWFYAPDRWAPMTGYQPAYGENIWMFITQGNARNMDNGMLHERSQIVQIAFPSDAGGIYM